MANPVVDAICIAGPTASGKTAAALAIAAALPVEIISVDSALVYRGMDIGTAKPSAAELASVPHHLIDILDPAQSYSAAQFVADATRLISEIKMRGKLPLLVGGTMLYFKALIDGIDDMPPANADIRAEIDTQAKEKGWPAMHAALALVDPITAARLSPNDSQRIQRALEVFQSAGKPLSAFHTADKKSAIHAPLIALEPQDRAWLHTRIAQRWDAMVVSGFEAEVRALKARPDLHEDLPSIRCVGYRQMWGHLGGHSTAAEMREQAVAATRQLAKRQITWLRSMAGRTIVPCDSPYATEEVVMRVQQMAKGR